MSKPLIDRGDQGRLYAMRGRDWCLAFVAGALIWTPGLLAIVGWASHWNAYVNLTNTLGFFVYLLVARVAWRAA